MLSLEHMASILENIEYKPGWKMDVYETPTQGLFWRLRVSMEDSYNPGTEVDLSIESALPMPLLNSEMDFVNWLRWRLEQIEVHECHEWLRWINDGPPYPIFDPHDDMATKPKDTQ